MNIDSKELRAFAKRHDPDDVAGTVRALQQVADSALASPAQYNLIGLVDGLAIAVHVGDRLVLGLRHGTSKKPWKLERLSKDPLRNRAKVEAWATAKARAKDAFVVAAPATVAPIVDGKSDLLAQVVAEPANLEVRRVYADWLIEQGDVRGELVHLQCEIEANGDRETLTSRALDLEKKHFTWIASRLPYASSIEIRGGLVERVEMYASKLPKYGAQLFSEHPVRHLTLFVKDPIEAARVAKLPVVVEDLTIEGRVSPTSMGAAIGLASLGKSTWFRRVRRLTLRSVSDKVPAWAAFWKAIDAPMLETIELEYPSFGIAGYAALPSVKQLVLFCPLFAHEGTPPKTAYAVCELLAKRTLDALELRSWHVGDAALAKCIAMFSRVKELRLVTCTMGAAVAGALARSTFERIAIRDLYEDDALLAFLAHVPRTCRELALDDASDAVVDAVIATPKSLRVRIANVTHAQRTRLGSKLI